MTYNEWRDELKSNLLCVSESERRRVLDYYAEAYADRRDAGFTEREIIDDFGAPYDAAKKLLAENEREEYFEPPRREEVYEEIRREKKSVKREEVREERSAPLPPPPEPKRAPAIKQGENYMWVFVLLCIIFCVPLFGLVMTMLGITVGFFLAPFFVIIAGAVQIGVGIFTVFGGSVGAGLCSIGTGLICLGIGVILLPLFIKLVKLMWKLFNMFFNWLKSLFRGKEVNA